MKLSEQLLPEFDQEMAGARRTLERIPEDKFTWKPHDKSMTLGRLSTHLAEIPGWVVHALETDQLDLAPPGAPPFQPTVAASRRDLLDLFDKNVAKARANITAAGDGDLLKPWSLLKGGQTMMTMPRLAVVRSFCLNHLIHHRAQLGVYLRLNGVPVPSIYGPSADEGRM